MMAADALAFALKNWKLVLGGIVAAVMLTIITVQAGEISHVTKQRDQNAATATLANSKLAISNASIQTLNDALDEKNAESQKRADDYAASKVADAQSIADMDARAKADASRLETLQRLAKDLPDNPNCKAPAALLEQLKGL